ncbi:hypothetical protein JCM18918_2941 [Cutibacterium acnes JCM 18918]|nr:hypothetical protein JCM18918_2941 [Cutibacterium acnes JCM 18918]
MVVAFIMVVNDTAGEPYWLAQVAGDAGEPWSSTRCVPWLEPGRSSTQNRCSEVEPSQVMVACPARPDSDLGRNDHCALRRLHGQTRIRPAHAGWSILGVTVLSTWAWTVAGIALGLWLHVAVAAPIALATPLVWVTFPPGMSIYWLRHLTGSWIGCCTITQTLNPLVITGTLRVELGLLVAAVVVVSARAAQHGRRLLLSLGGCVLVIGFIAGAVQVRHLDAFPTIDRELSVTCRTVEGADVQLCLLPEHEAERSLMASSIKRVFPIWKRAGIGLPSIYSEQALPGHKDAVEISVSPDMPDAAFAIARLATATGHCFCPPASTSPTEVIQYEGRIDAWLREVARASGMEVVGAGVDAEDVTWAERLRTKDPTTQAVVVTRMQKYLRDCYR